MAERIIDRIVDQGTALVLAFIIVSIVSAAYMIAGAILLGPPHELLPSDAKLVQEQLIIFILFS